MSGMHKWADIRGDVTPEREAEIQVIKDEARADRIAFSLKDLRQAREITQVELSQRLQTAQPSISSMENSGDNLVSTVRSVVEGMGGRLEMVAVFGDERIALET